MIEGAGDSKIIRYRRSARDKLVLRVSDISDGNHLLKVEDNSFDSIVFIYHCICDDYRFDGVHLSDQLCDESRIASEYEFMNLVFIRLIKFQDKRLNRDRILRDDLILLPFQLILLLHEGDMIIERDKVTFHPLFELRLRDKFSLIDSIS